MAMRRRRGKSESLPVVSLTPLIDTILVLLIVFMVTHSGTPKSAPAQRDIETTKETPRLVHLMIDQNCAVYLNGERTALEDVKEQLTKLLSEVPSKTVVIESDVLVADTLLLDITKTVRSIEGAHCVIK